jgi:putative hydrolase of the HAD superfamily
MMPDGTYSSIVFDCADTLLRMEPSRAEIFKDAVDSFGLAVPVDDIERAYDIVDFAIRMRSSELQSKSAKMEFYLTINSMLCDVLGIRRSLSLLHPLLVAEFRRRKRWRPFPDVRDTLRHLAERVPLYVLANWDSDLPMVLKQADLHEYFRDAISSESLGAEKPSHACFEKFLMRTSLNPATTIYVGNEYVADIVGARNAGLTPVLIDREQKVSAADCLRVSTAAELVCLLDKHLPDSDVRNRR